MAATVPASRGSSGFRKPSLGHQQQAGIECRAAVILGEALLPLVEAVLADVGMNGRANLPPFLDRPLEAELLDALDRAIEGDPAHHSRMGECPRFAAHLPDAAVEALPDLLEMLEQHPLKAPCLARGAAARPRAPHGACRSARRRRRAASGWPRRCRAAPDGCSRSRRARGPRTRAASARRRCRT